MSNDKQQRYVVKQPTDVREGTEYVAAWYGSGNSQAVLDECRRLNDGTERADGSYVWRYGDAAGCVGVIVDTQRTDVIALDPKGRGEATGMGRMAHDPVASPSHYRLASGVECREVIAELGLNFNRGSSFKYIWRAGRKQGASELEDLRKARECLDHEIARLGGDS